MRLRCPVSWTIIRGRLARGWMIDLCSEMKIEAQSETSKDMKDAQAHLDQNVLARYASW